MKYKLKDGEKYGLPKQVEAVQYNGVLYGEPWVTKAFNDGVLFWDSDELGGYPRNPFLLGGYTRNPFLRVEDYDYSVDYGDYLILCGNGEIEMCSKDVFEFAYEKGV